MSATSITTTQAKMQQEVKQAKAAGSSMANNLYDQFTQSSKKDTEFLSYLRKELKNVEAIFSDSSRKEHEALKNGKHKFSILGEQFYAKAEGEEVHVVCIGEKLGEGTFTNVYGAIQLSTRVNRAAQVVFKQGKTGEEIAKYAQEQMRNAIQIKTKLPQESVFTNKHFVVYGDSYTEERCSIDLFAQISCLKRTKETSTLRLQWVKEYYKAVQAMHEKDVVHRDLKAQNVLLSAQGGVCLTDWGTAITGSNPSTSVYASQKLQPRYKEWLWSSDEGCFDRAKSVDLICVLNDAYVVLMSEDFIHNIEANGVTTYTTKEELAEKLGRLSKKYSDSTVSTFRKYFLGKDIPDFKDFGKEIEAFGVLEEEQKLKQADSTTLSSVSAEPDYHQPVHQG